MYAVIRTGGKQLRVAPGDRIEVELIGGEPGARVELGDVLFVGGETPRVGQPLVEGARVLATVLGEAKGPKIRIFKYKRRKRYRLRRGHRQRYTQVRIEAIEV